MAIEHERIRDIRKAAGIKTQQDFAERLGVSTETISKIEQGKNTVTVALAKKVADEFNTTLDYIYGLSDDTNDDAATMLLYLKKLFNYRIDGDNKDWFIISVKKCVLDFFTDYKQATDLFKSDKIPEEVFNLWVDNLKSKLNAVISDDTAMSQEYRLIPADKYRATGARISTGAPLSGSGGRGNVK